MNAITTRKPSSSSPEKTPLQQKCERIAEQMVAEGKCRLVHCYYSKGELKIMLESPDGILRIQA